MSPHSIKIKVKISTPGDYHAPKHENSLPVLIVWLIIICAYFLSENGPVFCFVTKTLKQHGCPGDFEIPVLLGIPAWENIEKICSFHALAPQGRSDKTLHSSEMPSQRLGLLQIIEGKQITLPEKKKKKTPFTIPLLNL